MIFEQDIPVFPHGVVLEGERILDHVSGQTIPINGTALFVLSRVDGNRTVEDLARLAAARYGVRAEETVSDILQLLSSLNEKYLLNIRSTSRQRMRSFWNTAWFAGISLLAGYGQMVWDRKRMPVTDESRLGCFFQVIRRLFMRTAFTGCMIGVVFWVLSGAAISALWLCPTIALAFLLSLTLHEAAHAAMLAPAPMFVGVIGPVVRIQHGPVLAKQALLVSAAGPIFSGAAGVVIVAGGVVFGFEVAILIGVMLLFNLLGMTVAAPDGRNCLRHFESYSDRGKES